MCVGGLQGLQGQQAVMAQAVAWGPATAVDIDCRPPTHNSAAHLLLTGWYRCYGSLLLWPTQHARAWSLHRGSGLPRVWLQRYRSGLVALARPRPSPPQCNPTRAPFPSGRMLRSPSRLTPCALASPCRQQRCARQDGWRRRLAAFAAPAFAAPAFAAPAFAAACQGWGLPGLGRRRWGHSLARGLSLAQRHLAQALAARAPVPQTGAGSARMCVCGPPPSGCLWEADAAGCARVFRRQRRSSCAHRAAPRAARCSSRDARHTARHAVPHDMQYRTVPAEP